MIETAAGLEHGVFDKTGTLTLGRPLVTDVYGDDPDYLLLLAASLEQSSRHPLAYALLQEAQRRELALRECENVRTVSGQGLEGHVDGASARVRVGKPDWLEGQGVAIAPAAKDWLSAAEGSVVAVAVGAVLVGLVPVSYTHLTLPTICSV